MRALLIAIIVALAGFIIFWAVEIRVPGTPLLGGSRVATTTTAKAKPVPTKLPPRANLGPLSVTGLSTLKGKTATFRAYTLSGVAPQTGALPTRGIYSVRTGSVSTGDVALDKLLCSASYLDCARRPVISFSLKTLAPGKATSTLDVGGTLSFGSTTRDVSFQLKQGENGQITGNFELQTAFFGLAAKLPATDKLLRFQVVGRLL